MCVLWVSCFLHAALLPGYGLDWPVLIIDCLSILRLNGCAFSFIRVLACMTSWGSCGARVSISWKRQVIFVANSMWYFQEAGCVCLFVCVYVLVCVWNRYTDECVCFSFMYLSYVVVCCLMFYFVLVGCTVRMGEC